MPEPRPAPGAVALGRRIARDSLALAPSYVVPGIASLLAIPLLFKPLGADGYGTWALVFAIANGVPVVTSSWLEAISVRFGHRAGRGAGPRQYAASVVASCIAAALLARWIIPGADGTIVVAAVAFTAAVVVYLLVQARLQARMAFAAMSRSASIRAISGAVLAVAAAVATGAPGPAAMGAALGFGIGALVALPEAVRPAGVAGTGSAAGSAPAGLSPSLGGELGFGAASAVVALAAYVLSVGDRFVLTSLRPLAEVGTYAATYAVVDLVIRLAPSIVFGVVRPRLFRAWDRGDRRAAADAVSTLSAVLAWGTAALVAAGVILTSVAPVTRLDPRLVGPIAVGLGAFVVGNAVALLYASDERQARQAVHVVVGALLNIALNIALDGSLGATGAAIATSLSYAFVLVLHVHGLRRTLAPAATLDLGLAVAVAAIAGSSVLFGPVPGAVAGALAGATVLLRAWFAWRGRVSPGDPATG